jgi:glycosyltransferase involved in cell wall biosynthesis
MSRRSPADVSPPLATDAPRAAAYAPPAVGGPPRGDPASLRVQILLSTYDGAAYLPALLASLDAQTHHNVDLLVRDDGSRDDTLGVFVAHTRHWPAVITSGRHVGVPESFLLLLRDADPAADLYAFCDQDDVWLPGKLERAVRTLHALDPERPALYCSRPQPVDAALAPLGAYALPRRALGFATALVENRAPGCTVTFNRAARALLMRHVPRAAQMHDHWAYLVVSAFGTVHYDPEPQMWYRQHDRNTIGSPAAIVARLHGLSRRGWLSRIFAQAEEFDAAYGDALDPALRRVLDRFLASRTGLRKRLAYAVRPDVYRQARGDDLALRLMLALGLH